MSDEAAHQEYDQLPKDDDWIRDLRQRLPYSFKKIRNEKNRFILSEPDLLGSDYHNFWRRGYAYYVIGKLADMHEMARLWIGYRALLADRVQRGGSGMDHMVSKYPASEFYNCMQMEKLWAPVGKNHLDRERVLMTNMCQAIELCLKAVKTHTEYRENGEFMFEAGHNLKNIFESLPDPLQETMRQESKVFARQYVEFRKTLEKDVQQLQETPRQNWNWEKIGMRLETTSYTAILGMNDPWPDAEDKDWFEEAIGNIGDSTYHRYSPDEGHDLYPVPPIHNGLQLARFLYEHLFSVPSGTAEGGVVTQLMSSDLGVLGVAGQSWPGKAFFPSG